MLIDILNFAWHNIITWLIIIVMPVLCTFACHHTVSVEWQKNSNIFTQVAALAVFFACSSGMFIALMHLFDKF